MKPTFLLALLCFALLAPASAQSWFGNALLLDGDGDYVLVPDDPSLDFETMDNFTIMARFKTVTDAEMRILYKLQAQAGLLPVGYGIFVNYGVVNGVTWSDVRNGISVDAPSLLSPEPKVYYDDGHWHHVAFMREGIRHKIYMDGELISERADGAFESIANPNFMTIGAAFPGVVMADNYYFNGLIDEVQIWKRVLTETEISGFRMDRLPQSVYENPSNGLVAYYDFEEIEDLGVGAAGANDIRDRSTSGNHGDLVGDATVSEDVLLTFDFDMPLLTVRLWSVSMYWGRKLVVRVVDLESGDEVGRRTVDEIDDADVIVELDVLKRGNDYQIDVWIDQNENDVYDPPPTDAAWRRVLSPALGNDVVDLVVDFNYDDISMPALPVWDRYEALWMGTGSNSGTDAPFTVSASLLLESGVVSVGLEMGNLMDYFDLLYVYLTGTYSMEDGSGTVAPSDPPGGKSMTVGKGRERSFELTSSAASDWSGTVTITPDWTVSGDLLYEALGQTIDISLDGTLGLSQAIFNLSSTALGTDAIVVAEADVVMDATATGIERDRSDAGIPDAVSLSQNYPNPVFPSTTIPFRLVQPAEVTIGLYDLLGRRVATLLDMSMTSGEHEVEFNGSDYPSGMYVYRMTAIEHTGRKVEESKKLVILK